MRERDAQAVLLVRAVEETDGKGRILPEHERAAATRQALERTGAADPGPVGRRDAVRRRARTLLTGLEDRHPALQRALASLRGGPGAVLPVYALALVVGLATNLLGPQRSINLLAAPLLGLLAWNLLVYLAVPLVRALGSKAGHGPVVTWLAGVLAARPRRSLQRLMAGRDDTAAGAGIAAAALGEFAARWRRAAGPLLAARVRRTLHVAALVMAGGAVGGMYLRGIAFEYRATWESTLLEADGVQALLSVVLGPAAALLGTAVPSVAPLEAPASGNAATWIHLYATTTLLVVGLPRAALAALEGLRASRLAADIPVELDEGYVRGVLSDWTGESRVVSVQPYALRLGPRAAESLKSVAHAFFGARSHVEILDAAEYGDEPGPASSFPEGAGRACRVLLFNLAQTPEREVHGRFMREAKALAGGSGNDLLVLVDGSGYRQQVGSAERAGERLEAWREVAAASGLSLAEVDLAGGAEDGASARNAMAGALWSPEAGR
jgi:hypothetical protein